MKSLATPLVDVEGDDHQQQRLPRRSAGLLSGTRRWKTLTVLGVTLAAVACVTVYFIAGLPSPSFPSSEGLDEHDDRVTGQMFASLNAAVDDGVLVLNSTTLKNADIAEFFTSTINAPSLTITLDVPLALNDDDQVVVQGHCSVFGQDLVAVDGTLFFNSTTYPKLFLRLLPATPFTMGQVVDGEMDDAVRNMELGSTTVMLSSYDHTLSADALKATTATAGDDDATPAQGQVVSRGLWMQCSVALGGDSRLAQIAQFVEEKLAWAWGKLKPDFHVSFNLPNVDIGATVSLVNTTVTIERREPVFNVNTSLVIKYPDEARPIVFRSGVDFDLTNTQMVVHGDLQTPWQLPAWSSVTQDLTLERSSASIRFSVAKSLNTSRIVSGQVMGEVAYDDVWLGLAWAYPAADKRNDTVIELMVADDNINWGPLPSLPFLDTTFPKLHSERTTLVLSPLDTKHCFITDHAPTTSCVDVKKGMNLFAAVNFTLSAPLLAVPATDSQAQSWVMLLQGHYSKELGIDMRMQAPDTLALTHAVALNTATFTFTDDLAKGNPHVTVGMTCHLTATLSDTHTISSDATATIQPPLTTIVVSLEGGQGASGSGSDPALRVPVVGNGELALDSLKLTVAWNNSAHTSDLLIEGTGEIGGIEVSARLSAHFDSRSDHPSAVTCWDAVLSVEQPVSILELGTQLTAKQFPSSPVTTEMRSFLDAQLSNTVVEANIFCHAASVSFVLSAQEGGSGSGVSGNAALKIFGDVFVSFNATRYVAVPPVVSALLAEASAVPDSPLAGVTDQLNSLSSSLASVPTLFSDPFPSTTVGDYLRPLRDLVNASLAVPNHDSALEQALPALEALVTNAAVCGSTLSTASLATLDTARSEEFSLAVLPLLGWEPNTSFDLLTLNAKQVVFSVTSSDVLFDVDLQPKDLPFADEAQVRAVLKKRHAPGLEVEFSLFPQQGTDRVCRGLHWLFPDLKELHFSGELHGDQWKLTEAVVQGSVELGPNVAMSNQTLVVQSALPHVFLSSHVDVQAPGATLGFDATGSFVSDTNFTLSADSSNTWTFDVGNHGLNMTKLHLSLSVRPQGATPTPAPATSTPTPSPAALHRSYATVSSELVALTKALDAQAPLVGALGIDFSLAVSGEVVVGVGIFDASLRITPTDAFAFNASLRANPPLPIGNLVSSLCGDVSSALQSVAEMANPVLNAVAFAGADLRLDVSPPSLAFSGRAMYASKVESDFELRVERMTTADGLSEWGYVVGLAFATASPFSNLAPSIQVLDDFQFGPPALVIASHPAVVTFNFPEARPNDPPVTYNVKSGLSFFASLQMPTGNDNPFSWIEKHTGVQEVFANAHFASLLEFELVGGLEGEMGFLSNFKFTELGLVLVVHPAEVKVGFDATAHLVPPIGGDLTLYGRALAGELGVFLQFASLEPWNDPIGLAGLTIDQCDLEGEVSYELVPVSLGIAGGMHFGAIGGSADYITDFTTSDKYALKLELDDCVLKDMFDACCSSWGFNVSSHAQTLMETGVKKAIVYENPTPENIEFNGEMFPPGFRAEIDELLVLGFINASAQLVIRETALYVDGSVEPFEFTGIIAVGGYMEGGVAQKAARLDIHLDNSKLTMFRVDGSVSLFTVTFGAFVDFSDKGAALAVAFTTDLFNFTLQGNATGSLTSPTDFAVSAEMNNQVLDYIAATLPQKVIDAKTEYDSITKDTIQALEDARSNLQGLQNKIDEVKARDQEAADEATKKLKDAQNDVEHAKAAVDTLENRIEDLEKEIKDLPWYKKWKAVPLGTEIAALWVAKETADGVLSLAIDALKVAEAAVSHIPAIDPELQTLLLAYGAANAGIDALEATLKGADQVVDNIMDIEARLAGDMSKVFNPEYIAISGSLAKIKRADLAELTVDGYFVGDHVHFSIKADLELAEKLGSAVWTFIAHLFGLDGKLSYAQYLV